EMVVDARTAFDESRQDVVDILDGKGVVHAEIGDRTFLTGAMTIPLLACGIALATEQDGFALTASGDQGKYRIRFPESGQIVEIAVLTIRVVRIIVAQPFECRRHDDD